MHILTIVGNRPQFVKTAVLSPLLRTVFQETLIHTGQHYDVNMSDLFFRELGIPAPDVNLGVAPDSSGRQITEMTRALENELRRYSPDCVIVYGDTNSTLAGALAAVGCGFPLVHVEAGARSYDRSMPEEVNRLVADHNAGLLLCSSERCRANLAREGLVGEVFVVGDLMRDLVLKASSLVDVRWRELQSNLSLAGDYALLTVHRPSNVDDHRRLDAILEALERSVRRVVWPVHPRCGFQRIRQRFVASQVIHPIPPQGYLDFVALLKHARVAVTDSGGVQKEAYWLGVPCLTLREETEWVETVEAGWNLLVGADVERISQGVSAFRPAGERFPFYGDGQAAQTILEVLSRWGREASI